MAHHLVKQIEMMVGGGQEDVPVVVVREMERQVGLARRGSFAAVYVN